MDAARFPLTESQWAIWSVNDMLGDACMCLSATIPIPGGVDLGAFEAALRTLVARHDALRTVYRLVHQQLMQIVLPSWEYEVGITTVPSHDRSNQVRSAERVRTQLAAEVVDVAGAPPARFHVLRHPGGTDAVLVSVNHLACDGWGFKLLIDELTTLYRCHVERSPIPQSRNTGGLQPKDQAIWEAAPEGRAALRDGLAYWKSRLQDAPPHLSFPSGAAVARGATPAMACSFTLSPDLLARVTSCAGRANATPFHFFLAALRLLIGQAIGEEDVVVGAGYWNRRPQFLNVVGQFSKTLFLRDRIGGARTFDEILSAVRRSTLDAYAHAAYPSNHLHDWGIRDAWERGIPIPSWGSTSLDFNSPLPDALRLAGRPMTTRRTAVSRAAGDSHGMRLELTARARVGAIGRLTLSERVATPDSLTTLVDDLLSLVERCCSDRQVLVSDLSCRRLVGPGSEAGVQRVRSRGLLVDLQAIGASVERVPGVIRCTAEAEESGEGRTGEVEIVAHVQVDGDDFLSAEDLRAYVFRCLQEVPYAAMPHRIDVEVVQPARAPSPRSMTATEAILVAALGSPPSGIHTAAWDLGIRIDDVPRVSADLARSGLPPVPGLAWLFALPLTLHRVAAWIDQAGAATTRAC